MDRKTDWIFVEAACSSFLPPYRARALRWISTAAPSSSCVSASRAARFFSSRRLAAASIFIAACCRSSSSFFRSSRALFRPCFFLKALWIDDAPSCDCFICLNILRFFRPRCMAWILAACMFCAFRRTISLTSCRAMCPRIIRTMQSAASFRLAT